MTIEAYFEQPETPAKNSPVGVLMVKILAKNPDMDLEAARQEAHRLLDKAASRQRYAVPGVYSPEEQAARSERLRSVFGARKAA